MSFDSICGSFDITNVSFGTGIFIAMFLFTSENDKKMPLYAQHTFHANYSIDGQYIL